jgi:diphthamide biosynthesis protein 2
VFGKEIIDVEDCVDKFNNVMSRDISVVIIYDVIFDHIINSLYGRLISLYRDVTVAKLNVPMLHDVGVVSSGFVNGNDETKSFIKFGRIFNISRPLEDYKIFYIGGESPTLTNFMLTYTSNQFFSYNPADKICRFETRNVNRMLGHRYFLIQKAKEAKMVGILVGTLGAVDYLPMIDRVNEVLTTAGKKSYIIVVGKLNPAKLANFMEIEVFVLIACSHCSLIDSQEYFRPIITPYELEVACLSSRQWEGNIVMDYCQLLPGGDSHVTVETSSNVEPEYSFLSGHMLSMATDNDEGSTEGKSIVPKENTQLSLPHTGASHLQSRSWKGLERDIGKTPVTCTPLDGRSGLPSFYTHEEEHL